MLFKFKKFLHRYIYPLFIFLLPVKTNKVVFSSFAGRQYSDNPRTISEQLHKIHPEIHIVWLMNDARKVRRTLPSYVKVAENESFLAAYELYTAKVWVDNVRKPLFFKKREDTIYVQTWHGTPLKLIEADAGNKLSNKYKKYAKRDTENIDILISGNKHSTNIFSKAFNYYGQIMEIGTPRNDILINECKTITQIVRKKLGIFDENIILYAPTFRNEFNQNGFPQLDLLKPDSILDAFEKKSGKKYALLLRFHPNIANKLDVNSLTDKYCNRIINVSSEWDMQDLLCATDVLITDYSSVFFDFALLKRPIFLFAYDYKGYEEERGLYFDLDSLPICISKTSEELVFQIQTEDEESLKNRTIKLLNLLGNKEQGTAGLEIAKYISKITVI